MQLLGYGLKPYRVLIIMDREEKSMVPRDMRASGEEPAVRRVTLRDIENVRKKLAMATQLDENDALAVDKLVEHMRGLEDCETDDYILYYDRSPKEFQLAISSPFQRLMMQTFGRKLMFMDAVWGTNRPGYAMLTLLVQDDFGNGVPVAFCISDAEDSARWHRFIAATLTAAGIDPAELTFMIDKSAIERKAITDIGASYLLCIFHVMQEIERSLRKSDYGVHGPANAAARRVIISKIKRLMHLENQAAWEKENVAFKEWLRAEKHDLVADYYEKNWEADAPYWAAWGRVGKETNGNRTNNLIERWFGLFKYSFLGGKVSSRMEDLLRVLFFKVLPNLVNQRIRKVEGDHVTFAESADRRHDNAVDQLVSSNSVHIAPRTAHIGLAAVMSSSAAGTYACCLADMSCQCYHNRTGVCKHLEAVARVSKVKLDEAMLAAGVARIQEKDLLQALEGRGEGCEVYACRPLAFDKNSPIGTDGPEYFYVDLLEQRCTCVCYTQHNLCCHLLAALPADKAEALLAELREVLEFSDGGILEVKRKRRMNLIDIEGVLLREAKKQNKELHEPAVVAQKPRIDPRVTKLLSGIGRRVKSVNEEEVELLVADLERIYDRMGAKKEGLAPTEKVARKQQRRREQRSDNDRVMRTVDAGARKVDKPQLKQGKSAGRAPTAVRGETYTRKKGQSVTRKGKEEGLKRRG